MWTSVEPGGYPLLFAFILIAFCYPGRDVRGGDRPPPRCCAPLWHPRLRPHFAAASLVLLVGSYAIRRYLPEHRGDSAGAVLRRWREFLPEFFVLPHPSWRTTHWQRSNPWFEAELLPELRRCVGAALAHG